LSEAISLARKPDVERNFATGIVHGGYLALITVFSWAMKDVDFSIRTRFLCGFLVLSLSYMFCLIIGTRCNEISLPYSMVQDKFGVKNQSEIA